MRSNEGGLRLIPVTAGIIGGILGCIVGGASAFVLVDDPNAPLALKVIVPPFAVIVILAYALLLGYIHGDAKRRRMRHVLWTLLAIFIPNGIGIILYFVLRDPLPIYCTRCGGVISANHTFCPHCGASVKPACPKCGRAVETGWSTCPYCGTKLA